MFERYTQKARRVLEFARQHASNAEATCIESEHLLLGILKETHSVIQSPQKLELIKGELAGQEIKTAKAADMGLPLSNECKRILAYAAEEAERLNCRYIGTEHLFLGVLREEKCVAARVLRSRGIKLEDERRRIAQDLAIHAVLPERSDESAVQAVDHSVTFARVPARGRRIEFRNQADDSVLGTASGFDVPRIGEEIFSGTLQGKVTRVVHQYASTMPGAPSTSQSITIYVSLRPQSAS